MSFMKKLEAIWASQKSLVCVGLDPELDKIPERLAKRPDGIFMFNKAIIDATADLVCCFKPQFAHYAAVAAEDQLKATIDYIHDRYPKVPVILDAKRGDIGSTASYYAREAFERYGADAVTANPYLGGDAVKPFTDWADRGVVLLCRTSNPGGADLQELLVNGEPLYRHVARLAATQWNGNRNIALVVGATVPTILGDVRKIIGDMPILVPGVGAQGGDLAASVAAGQRADGKGLLISASRSVLYASREDNFAQAARQVVAEMLEQGARVKD